MLESVLIANRGEIACRIIRTAQGALECEPSRSIRTPMPTRCSSGWPTRPTASARLRHATAISNRRDHRGGEESRRRCHPSRLRLPVRARRIRGGLRKGRNRLRRPARIGDPGHGAEGRGEDTRATGRRSGGAGLSRRKAGHGVPAPEGLRDRLSGAHQGRGGRRRQGHAACRAGRPISMPRSRAPSAKPQAPSAIPACWSKNTFCRRAISRSRSSPMRMATWCISSSAIARCSAGTRK